MNRLIRSGEFPVMSGLRAPKETHSVLRRWSRIISRSRPIYISDSNPRGGWRELQQRVFCLVHAGLAPAIVLSRPCHYI